MVTKKNITAKKKKCKGGAKKKNPLLIKKKGTYKLRGPKKLKTTIMTYDMDKPITWTRTGKKYNTKEEADKAKKSRSPSEDSIFSMFSNTSVMSKEAKKNTSSTPTYEDFSNVFK